MNEPVLDSEHRYREVQSLYRTLMDLYGEYRHQKIDRDEYLRRIRPVDEKIEYLEFTVLYGVLYGETES